MMTMKKVLFVINTLGRAGAETALMELLRRMDPKEYDVSLYVLLGQGEMIDAVPKHVKLLNKKYDPTPVLSKEGKKRLRSSVLKAMFRRGNVFRLFPYLVKNLFQMIRKKKIMSEKLLWRILSDGAERFDTQYDMAVAYLEGGSSYYVADWVKADKKVAFVHVDYNRAGYTRSLDHGCYECFDKIFTVSDEVRESFLKTYPECKNKTDVFHNILNQEEILRRSKEDGGFTDAFDGTRILSVGRLTTQKAFEVSIDAMKLLKDAGYPIRWYVLGEGNQRKMLEDKITKLELQEDFLLPGATSNPYPYMRQADIYVHASRFEGKSIAIQEAQIVGMPIVASDCSGNREQIIHGEDGLLCDFSAQAIYEAVKRLLEDTELRSQIAKRASTKNADAVAEMNKILSLMEG